MNRYQAELYHHGIKGQKWGVRRYQNPDGSLTTAGRSRYLSGSENGRSKSNDKKPGLSDRQKKALKVGLAVAGTTLAVYGVYKVSKITKDKSIKSAQTFVSNHGAESIKELMDKYGDYSDYIKSFTQKQANDEQARASLQALKSGKSLQEAVNAGNKAFEAAVKKSQSIYTVPQKTVDDYSDYIKSFTQKQANDEQARASLQALKTGKSLQEAVNAGKNSYEELIKRNRELYNMSLKDLGY